MKAKTLPGAVGYDVLQYWEEDPTSIPLDGEYEVISVTDRLALLVTTEHGVLVVALSGLTVTEDEAYKRGQEAFCEGKMAAPAWIGSLPMCCRLVSRWAAALLQCSPGIKVGMRPT